MLIRVNIERVQTQQIILEVEGDELESLKQQKLASPAFFTKLNHVLETQKPQILAFASDIDWETESVDISTSHRTGVVDDDEGLVEDISLSTLLSSKDPTLF